MPHYLVKALMDENITMNEIDIIRGTVFLENIIGETAVMNPIMICTSLLLCSFDNQLFDIEILLMEIIEVIILNIKIIAIHSSVNGVQRGKVIKKIIIWLSNWQW